MAPSKHKKPQVGGVACLDDWGCGSGKAGTGGIPVKCKRPFGRSIRRTHKAAQQSGQEGAPGVQIPLLPHLHHGSSDKNVLLFLNFTPNYSC